MFSAFASVGDDRHARPAAARRRAAPRWCASRWRRSSASWASPSPGDQRPHSVPPGPHGGNIDINLLTVGLHPLPAGAGRRRAGLRRRPALRPGRRRGRADRDGGLAAGHGAPRRGRPRGRACASSASSSGRWPRPRSTWCPPAWTRTSTWRCRTACAPRSRCSRRATAWTPAWPTPTSAPPPTSTSPRSSTWSRACTPGSARPTSRWSAVSPSDPLPSAATA